MRKDPSNLLIFLVMQHENQNSLICSQCSFCRSLCSYKRTWSNHICLNGNCQFLLGQIIKYGWFIRWYLVLMRDNSIFFSVFFFCRMMFISRLAMDGLNRDQGNFYLRASHDILEDFYLKVNEQKQQKSVRSMNIVRYMISTNVICCFFFFLKRKRTSLIQQCHMLLNSKDFVQYINIATSYVISMEEKKR